MERQIKLLVTDIDGTFLDSASRLLKENILAVQSLSASGVRTVICTGRISSYTRHIVREASVCQTVISCNGALIYDFATEKILYKKIIAPESVQKITDFCLAEKIDICGYTTDGEIFHSRNSTRTLIFKKYNENISKIKNDQIAEGHVDLKQIPLYIIEENYENFVENEICKFLIFSENKDEYKKVRAFLEKIDVYVVSSMESYIDVMACGVSKGNAVKMIAGIFGVACDEICAVGDNQNDIDMFMAAGVSVCMANGHDDAKKVATFVTSRTNNDGGFAEAANFALGY